MTETLKVLGLPGVLLVVFWAGFLGYWATRPFRPEATWFSDLAKFRTRTRRRHRGASCQVVMAHGLWPRAEVGPRMWRWPLNSTRYVCAWLWSLVGHRRGLLGLIGRTAWYPSAGIGAAAALVQATVLVLLLTVPIAVVLVVIDSSTVLRGGIPPARRSHARKADVFHERRTRETGQRLAAIHAHHQLHEVAS